MKSSYILIIEDDEMVSRTIERSLRSEDFKLAGANNGEDGLKLAHKRPPDLVILDIVMPGIDGYAVCRQMRADPQLKDVPVLFLTAKIKDEDRIAGFIAGADDFLTKPFNLDELILRVRAILRRTQRQFDSARPNPLGVEDDLSPSARRALQQIQSGNRAYAAQASSQILVVGDYVLDTQSFELHTPQRGRVRLTPVQYDLVYHLMSHPGQIYSPARLLDEVWDYPIDAGSPDLVRVHIKNLRARVESNPQTPEFIRTVSGFGYTVGELNAGPLS
ncbi:MAG TPA: response regulator transcription factor [Anaerolineales bacterium]|nr:response regulator transcription factor [Anaerolineales bacterium]